MEPVAGIVSCVMQLIVLYRRWPCTEPLGGDPAPIPLPIEPYPLPPATHVSQCTQGSGNVNP